jgi:dephospho-CoA kinase
MLLLGLTGDIACGKSTVSHLLESFGATVIDADLLVRELYADKEFAGRVAALFNAEVLAPDGSVDRAALRGIVATDAAALKRLEELVHPAVQSLRDCKLQALREQPQPPRVVVVEAVKLIESGQAARCDAVWCVVCTREIQLRRLMEKRGLSESTARNMLERQPPFAEKIKRLEQHEGRSIPFVVIKNDGSLQELEQSVSELWQQLKT